jgi:uncharacterized membrane protein YeaQ/YmgE (transglycosylase-associated protein family)
MTPIVWLAIMASVGLLAGWLMRGEGQGLLPNALIGTLGASFGSLPIGAMVGVPTLGDPAFGVVSVLVSLLGAFIALGLCNLLRRMLLRSRVR